MLASILEVWCPLEIALSKYLLIKCQLGNAASWYDLLSLF